jgi:hypothetical protein
MKRKDVNKPMSQAWLLQYWRDFCSQTDPEYRDEYQFAQYLIERSDYT